MQILNPNLHSLTHAGSEDFLLDLGSWLEYLDALADKGLLSFAGITSPTLPAPKQSSSQACQEFGKKASSKPDPVVFDQQLTALYHTPSFRSYMSEVALSLLEHAITSACPHLADSVLRGMLRTGDSFVDLVARSQEGSGGLSLLDRWVKRVIVTSCSY